MKKTLKEIAAMLAEAMERHLEDGAYGAMIDGLELSPAQKKRAKGRVRWTLIDEATGENLLEDKKGEVIVFLDGGLVQDISLPKNLSGRVVDFDLDGIADGDICESCSDSKQPHYHHHGTYDGREQLQ
jgi:hypothetical protein